MRRAEIRWKEPSQPSLPLIKSHFSLHRFKNPMAVNPKQETDSRGTRRLHSRAPKGFILLRKNGESKWGAWKGGRRGLLGPSPFSREQCDVRSKETIFNAVRVPLSQVRGWGASPPRRALSSFPNAPFPFPFRDFSPSSTPPLSF